MRKLIIFICVGVILIIFVLMFLYSKRTHDDDIELPINLKVTSEAFTDGGDMPVKYTGRGDDLSPPLKFDEVSPQAKTIAIVMDDIDHPLCGVFNHWVIWNIPASFNDIPEEIPRTEIVSSLGNAVQGKSSYGGKHWYRGPLPPFGKHRYKFRVYVLDKVLDLKIDAGKSELGKAMEGHILQYGTLIGVFGK